MFKNRQNKESRELEKLQRFLARCSSHARGALDWLKPRGNIVAGVCHHSVVIVLVKRLEQVEGKIGSFNQSHGANNKWSNEKDKEQNEHREVENSEADDSSLPELRLLQ